MRMSTNTSAGGARGRPGKSRLQRTLRGVGNPLRMWSLMAGLPSPPYTRRNAIIVETIGRRSGKRRRLPVGFLEEDDGRLIVVVEDGLRAALGPQRARAGRPPPGVPPRPLARRAPA